MNAQVEVLPLMPVVDSVAALMVNLSTAAVSGLILLACQTKTKID